MLKSVRFAALVAAIVCGARTGFSAAAVATAPEDATITSDQMEIVDNGSKTVFVGHVELLRPPYMLHADKMTRYKDTEAVDAEGHINGTWVKPGGEKTLAEGGRAHYNPQTQITELWEKPRVTHWDNAKDKQPMVVVAQKFISHEDTQMLFAQEQVIIRRGKQFESQSDQAQFDQKMQVIHLWGKQHKTEIQWWDAQGSGHFFSERALLYISPKRARLMDRVTGHIIPGA